jgi:hypothetical protein
MTDSKKRKRQYADEFKAHKKHLGNSRVVTALMPAMRPVVTEMDNDEIYRNTLAQHMHEIVQHHIKTGKVKKFSGRCIHADIKKEFGPFAATRIASQIEQFLKSNVSGLEHIRGLSQFLSIKFCVNDLDNEYSPPSKIQEQWKRLAEEFPTQYLHLSESIKVEHSWPYAGNIKQMVPIGLHRFEYVVDPDCDVKLTRQLADEYFSICLDKKAWKHVSKIPTPGHGIAATPSNTTATE